MVKLMQPESWKCSSFNNVFHVDSKFLLFSSLTGRLLAFSERQYDTIRNNFDCIDKTGSLKDPELGDPLTRGGFIVPSSVNENEREHQKYLKEVNRKDRFSLVLAPTMRCNFSCSYCFERDAQKIGSMDRDTQIQLVELVREKARTSKRFDVQWFGGEPLLALDIIEDLSQRFQEICSSRGIVYEATMLTNGYCLTPEVIGKLGKLRMAALHITLDGTPETFAVRKGLSRASSRAFYKRLFSLIPQMLVQIPSLVIRINVDRDNKDEAYYVVNRLKDLSLNDPKMDVRLGLIETKSSIIECVPHNCLTTEEYLSFDLAFKRFLVSKGFTVYGYPTPLRFPCVAVKEHSCLVGPAGNMYGCVPEMGQARKSSGSLHEAPSPRMNTDKALCYKEFDPWQIEPCKYCSLMPICLGACPRRQRHEEHFRCTLKYNLPERLMFWHEYFQEHPLESRTRGY